MRPVFLVLGLMNALVGLVTLVASFDRQNSAMHGPQIMASTQLAGLFLVANAAGFINAAFR